MNRDRLPNRRISQTRIFGAFGRRRRPGMISTTRYPDGRLAEVFVSFEDEFSTSEAAAVARDASVLVSIALQHGVPVEPMRAAITRLDDETPASIVGQILDELCQ